MKTGLYGRFRVGGLCAGLLVALVCCAMAQETSATQTANSTSASATMPTLQADSAATTPATTQAPAEPQSSEAATSVTLPSGVIYQVIRPGQGREADTSSTRVIHYELRLENGEVVENSRTKEFPVPFRFAPGTDQAIPGMIEGTNSMKIGEIRKLYVPADQAYGDKVHGVIPANANLYFTVEMVDLTTPETTAPSDAAHAAGM